MRIFFFACLLMFTSPVCTLASGGDAANALEQIEFRCKSEIDYFDYVNLVKNAEFEVSKIQPSTQKNAMAAILSHYRYAISLWEWRTQMRGAAPSSYAGQMFFKDYPGSGKAISKGGVLHDGNEGFMSIDAAILHVWSQASSALKSLKNN